MSRIGLQAQGIDVQSLLASENTRADDTQHHSVDPEAEGFNRDLTLALSFLGLAV